MKIFNIDEFSKKLVWLFAINSVVWVYLSYLLAFLGKEQIAENLSEKIVIQIIGVTLIYCVKSLFENLSKHNSWPDKFDYSNNINEANDINVLDDNIPSI
jgi:ABC-type transport system involved in cytochrome bd biosynthesis fused ATPase/permease subunit